MYIIGITGGIGSGKSEVCRYLEEKYNATVFIADDISRAVTEPQGVCYQGLRQLFGEEYFLSDGKLDRKKAGEKAFKDESVLKAMNALIHPVVYELIEEGLKKARVEKRPLAVIEAAILIESAYVDICDEIWFVYAEHKERIRRLVDIRGITRERAEAIMNNQLSDEEFKKGCAYTLKNSGDFADTKKRIDERLSKRFGL